MNYTDLLDRHASSESLRALGWNLKLSCGTVQNRLDRLAISFHPLSEVVAQAQD